MEVRADPAQPERGPRIATPGVYSIGAVASILDVSPDTLRTWETRYGVIRPSRTPAGQRLYSREQVEGLRFIKAEIARGLSAADAHRLVALQNPRSASDAEFPLAGAQVPRMLVAERDRYSADLLQSHLEAQGFSVGVAFGVEQAKELFDSSRPDLTIVELLIEGGGGERLCAWLKHRATAPVLAVSALDAPDRAKKAGADAFLVKPTLRREIVGAVRNLLGLNRLAGPVPT